MPWTRQSEVSGGAATHAAPPSPQPLPTTPPCVWRAGPVAMWEGRPMVGRSSTVAAALVLVMLVVVVVVVLGVVRLRRR